MTHLIDAEVLNDSVVGWLIDDTDSEMMMVVLLLMLRSCRFVSPPLPLAGSVCKLSVADMCLTE